MKKLLLIMLVLALCFSCFVFVACKKVEEVQEPTLSTSDPLYVDPNATELPVFGADEDSLGMDVVDENAKILFVKGARLKGTTIDMELADSVEKLDLTGLVTVKTGCTWELYGSYRSEDPLPAKFIDFGEGNGGGKITCYIVVKSEDEKATTTYVLNIFKNYETTAYFYAWENESEDEENPDWKWNKITEVEAASHTKIAAQEAAAEYPGYTFAGWYLVNESYNVPYQASTGDYDEDYKYFYLDEETEEPVAYDSTLVGEEPFNRSLYFAAKYTPIEYTIDLDLNAEDAEDEDEPEIDETQFVVTYATKAADYTFPVPTRVGFDFAGWYLHTYDEDGKLIEEVKVSSSTIDEDEEGVQTVAALENWTYSDVDTLYAHWTAKKVKVSVHNRNISEGRVMGSLSESRYYTYDYNSYQTITATPDSGHSFIGWYDIEGNVVSTDMRYTFQVPATDVAYWADFTAYTVTLYRSLDDKINYDEYSYSYGYTQTKYYGYPDYTIYGSSKNSTITFDMNGGDSNYAPEAKGATANFSYPEIPTRDGYVFAGWYDNAQCLGSPFDFNSNVIKDTTLYAKWIEHEGDDVFALNETKYSVYATGRDPKVTDIKENEGLKLYAFVPLQSGYLTFYTRGNADTYGYIFNSEKNLIYSNDDGGKYNNFYLTEWFSAGQLYYIAVAAYGEVGFNVDEFTMEGASFPSGRSSISYTPYTGKGMGYTTHMTSENVTVGHTIYAEEEHYSNDWTWVGWFDENDALVTSARTLNVDMPASDKRYYAKYITRPVTVANASGTSYGKIEEGLNKPTALGEIYTLEASNNSNYSNNTFLGWYEVFDDGRDAEKVSASGSFTFTFTMTRDKHAYEARWARPTLTIKENSNGNNKYGSIESYTIPTPRVVGDTFTVTAKTNEETNYVWMGWYDENGKKVTDSKTCSITIDGESHTYTARWRAFNLTTEGEGSVQYNVNNVNYNSDVYFSAEAADGYTFSGWYVDNVLQSSSTTYNIYMQTTIKNIKAVFVKA